MSIQFVLRRFGLLLIVIWAATTLNFIIPRLSPDRDPIREKLGQLAATGGLSSAGIEEMVEAYQEKFGLNKPLIEQYFTYNQMDRCISIEPLGYMRGRTFNNTLIIADEMQNSTPNQMLMLLTRVGPGTRLIVTGDLEQSDLAVENGLSELIYKMQLFDLKYLEHVKMTQDDIVRHPAVKEVLKVLRV